MGLFEGTHQNYYSNEDKYGGYQFVTLANIISNFTVSYVGEGKIIPKASRTDIAYHAQRGLQELSYDTFKSTKSQEIEVPPSLTMVLPHDYVNYVKVTWADGGGTEMTVYPTGKSSNPLAIIQDSNYDYTFDGNEQLPTASDSTTWDRFRDSTTAASDTVSPEDASTSGDHAGGRYGSDPQHMQANGTFYIDPIKGKIYFSGDLSGRLVTLKYISDSLATDDEMIVHKLAEEAMYKYIAYAILSTSANVPEYIVRRHQKDKFAAVRKAKLRLSNLKMEELAQVMRGKSKQIKH